MRKHTLEVIEDFGRAGSHDAVIEGVVDNKGNCNIESVELWLCKPGTSEKVFNFTPFLTRPAKQGFATDLEEELEREREKSCTALGGMMKAGMAWTNAGKVSGE